MTPQLTWRWGPLSLRLHGRTLLIGVILTGLTLGVLAATLLTPGAGITARQAGETLLGAGEGIARTVVLDWRLPRALAALVVGAALALSGALFQAVTRNPLGSPDIIGFNTGAYTGVILVVTSGYVGFFEVSLGAFLGGLLTAALVLAFTARHHISGLRLILVGIGVAYLLSSLNRWLILRGDMEQALSAATWGAGTLNGVQWIQILPAGAVLLLLSAVAVSMRRHVDLLRLGDDTAGGLGLTPQRAKAGLVLLGAVLTAVSTALAGPVSFVALAAPHIAARLSHSPRCPLLLTAVTGALLLLFSDLLAQRLFAPVQLPVGLVTVVVGGIYLLWLISRPTLLRQGPTT
ncbi:FecCD family ABC transporter permease [Corynebacterium nasicanis]|uniref:FecCD family ABC transporter permease n=1 Tax=Corynebacterium nasicanis TaxID=1448267 RepID=A0ABW1QB50_9CORY